MIPARTRRYRQLLSLQGERAQVWEHGHERSHTYSSALTLRGWRRRYRQVLSLEESLWRSDDKERGGGRRHWGGRGSVRLSAGENVALERLARTHTHTQTPDTVVFNTLQLLSLIFLPQYVQPNFLTEFYILNGSHNENKNTNIQTICYTEIFYCFSLHKYKRCFLCHHFVLDFVRDFFFYYNLRFLSATLPEMHCIILIFGQMCNFLHVKNDKSNFSYSHFTLASTN